MLKKYTHYFTCKYIVTAIFITYMLLWLSGGWVEFNGTTHVSLEMFKEKSIAQSYGADFFVKGYGGGVFTLFSPLIAGYSAVMFALDKRKSGYIKFELYRVGKKRFILQSYVSACLMIGFIFAISYLLFSFTVCMYVGSGITLNLWIDILKNMIRLCLCSAAHSVSAQILSVLLRGRYMIICIPFLLSYTYNSFLTSRVLHLLKTGNIKYLTAIENLSFEAVLVGNTFSLFFVGIFLGAGFYVYSFLLKRQLKYGGD